MRILFTSEGTYPYAVGGVSTWCDQLIAGLPHHSFHLLAVSGPKAQRPVYRVPDNVVELDNLRLWDTGRKRRHWQAAPSGQFGECLHRLLRLTDDQEQFADGLYGLACLADVGDLAAAFEGRAAWNEMQQSLEGLVGRPPKLAEIALALNWLKASVAPVLFIPTRADLAHTVANGLSAIPAWVAARAHRIPLILTEHGLYLRERYLSFGEQEEAPGLRLLRARFHRALAQLIYRDADRCISVSEFNRRWQVELGAPANRTSVIYNGVSPERFPLAPAESQKVPTVSWVGRVDPLKDLATLIDAFGLVRRRVRAARLRLYGPVPEGNENYYSSLRRLVSGSGLDKVVTFEGPINPVYQAYHSADVVALSSVSEGFPYTTIEAMMCGKPVVATRVGGIGEAISDLGRLVEPRNTVQMGEALTELLLDSDLRRSLGEGARARALEYFTLERMKDAYDDLYLRPLQSPRYAEAAVA